MQSFQTIQSRTNPANIFMEPIVHCQIILSHFVKYSHVLSNIWSSLAKYIFTSHYNDDEADFPRAPMSNKNESKREERVKTPPTLGLRIGIEVRVFCLHYKYLNLSIFVEEDHLFFESEHCTPKINIQIKDMPRQGKTKQDKARQARDDRKDKTR